MSDRDYPNIVNLYVNPGQKPSIHINQPAHLAAIMTRRGANKICFKMVTEYCNRNHPGAYNNSLMDVSLSEGTIKLYPKALDSREIFESYASIAREFVKSGIVPLKNCNFDPFISYQENLDLGLNSEILEII